MPRGDFRRNYCDFPPLMLNFKSKDSIKGEFFKINKLKMVTQCKTGNEEVYINALREFLYLKEEFYKVINEFPYLKEKSKKEMIFYLDGFLNGFDKRNALVLC